jgi:ABC-2 type transport system ATP-binding protein
MKALSHSPDNGVAHGGLGGAAQQSDGGWAIEAQGLTKRFGDVQAVNGIDLQVPRGQIFGFLGVNGSGKSTTVRMLATLMAPTAGQARVGGLDVATHARAVRRKIGVALQEVGLDALQTGRELLWLQARLHRVERIEDRIEKLLDVVDLERVADRRIGTYSGGMRRRLDLASALVHEPEIVFLDEPTTGLDPISRESLWRYVERLNQEDGVTFFLTTQYLEEVDRLAHDVAILHAGEIVMQGSPRELKASIGAEVVIVELSAEPNEEGIQILEALRGVKQVRTEGAQMSIDVADGSAAISSIVRALDGAGLAFGAMRISQPTLDDVFLRLTGDQPER